MPSYLFSLFLLSFLFLLSSCSPIKEDPFSEFKSAATKVRTEASELLRDNSSLAAERHLYASIDALRNGDDSLIQQFRIGNEDNPLDWDSSSAPLFLKAERFTSTVEGLNALLEDYATALEQLASPERVSVDRLNTLGQDLNDNSFNLLVQLKANPRSKDTALFSTAATAAFELYLRKKQRTILKDAILSHQVTIKKLSTHMVLACRLAATHALQEYKGQFERLEANLATDSGLASDAVLTTNISAMIELSRAYVSKIESLRALAKLYEKLPDAHSELAKAATNPKITLSSINTFLSYADRLASVAQRNITANELKTAQAIAKQAKAASEKAQADSTAASNEASKAREIADQAAAEASENPEDTLLGEDAQKLQEAAESAEAAAAEKAKIAENLAEVVVAADLRVEELKTLLQTQSNTSE